MALHRLLALVLVPTLLASFSGPAGAHHPCEPSTTRAHLDVTLPTGERYYVWNGLTNPFNEDSLFIYEEANGIDGLQRGDEWVDDTCGGHIAPDRVVF